MKMESKTPISGLLQSPEGKEVGLCIWCSPSCHWGRSGHKQKWHRFFKIFRPHSYLKGLNHLEAPYKKGTRVLGSHWQSMGDLKSLRTINEPCNMRKVILEILSEADSLRGWNWLMSLTSTSTLGKVWGPAKTQGTKKHEAKVWCTPEILLLPYKRNLDIKLNVWWGS